ncbi:HAD-like domain-containing protein [Aspergillus floccosus]
MITLTTNQLLEQYRRPALTASIRAQLMGVPDSTSGDIFHNWAKVPIPREQFASELKDRMRKNFQNCTPLPGAETLLLNLSRALNASGDRIELALASSTKSQSFELKISRPETKHLLGFFQPERRVLGDDSRPILPSECLVFEDSVVGVEAGRRAGMRVIWVSHPDVAAEYHPRQKDIFRDDNSQVGAVDDGWAEIISSLEEFNYERNGIDVRF